MRFGKNSLWNFFEFFISVVRGCSLNLSMSYREVRDSWFNFSIHLKCIFFISSFVLFQFGAGWEHVLNFSNMSFLQPARIWKIYEELLWEKLKDEWSEVEWQQKWTRSEQSWWRKIFDSEKLLRNFWLVFWRECEQKWKEEVRAFCETF